MEFPLILPADIYKARGSKSHMPHVMQSPFAGMRKANNNNNNNSSNNNSSTTSHGTNNRQNNFESFNMFNGYNENDEVLPHEEVPPEPLMPGPQLEGLIAPPGLDGSVTRSAFGVPKARRSPLVLWTPSRNASGLSAQAITESRFNRWYYMATLRTFGFDYLKPPGVPKTLKTMLEEEEMSEMGEESLDLDVGMMQMPADMSTDGLVPGPEILQDQAMEEVPNISRGSITFDDVRQPSIDNSIVQNDLEDEGVEEPDEGEEEDAEEEADLDAEIEEAEEFNYDYSDDEYDEGEYEGPLFDDDDYQQDDFEETHRTPQTQPRTSMTPATIGANASFIRHTPHYPHEDEFSFDEDTERSFFYNSHASGGGGSTAAVASNNGYFPSSSSSSSIHRPNMHHPSGGGSGNNGNNHTRESSTMEFDFSNSLSSSRFDFIAESTARSLLPAGSRSANHSLDSDHPDTLAETAEPRMLPPVRYSRPSLITIPPLGPPPLRQSSGVDPETPYSLTVRSESLTPPPILSAAAAAVTSATGLSSTAGGPAAAAAATGVISSVQPAFLGANGAETALGFPTTVSRRGSRRVSTRYDSEYGIGPESPETPGRTQPPPGAAVHRRYSRLFFANPYRRGDGDDGWSNNHISGGTATTDTTNNNDAAGIANGIRSGNHNDSSLGAGHDDHSGSHSLSIGNMTSNASVEMQSTPILGPSTGGVLQQTPTAEGRRVSGDEESDMSVDD